jgi:hypothetical protein
MCAMMYQPERAGGPSTGARVLTAKAVQRCAGRARLDAEAQREAGSSSAPRVFAAAERAAELARNIARLADNGGAPIPDVETPRPIDTFDDPAVEEEMAAAREAAEADALKKAEAKKKREERRKEKKEEGGDKGKDKKKPPPPKKKK